MNSWWPFRIFAKHVLALQLENNESNFVVIIHYEETLSPGIIGFDVESK
jgi:hypothetical protein